MNIVDLWKKHPSQIFTDICIRKCTICDIKSIIDPPPNLLHMVNITQSLNIAHTVIAQPCNLNIHDERCASLSNCTVSYISHFHYCTFANECVHPHTPNVLLICSHGNNLFLYLTSLPWGSLCCFLDGRITHFEYMISKCMANCIRITFHSKFKYG